MNWFGGGLINIMIYSGNNGSIIIQDFAILTENSFDIETENSNTLIIES